MGGGDLNLKKSWHTQTFRNIELVWKAEQKVEEQNKRNEARMKELREEKARTEMIKMQEEAGLIPKRGDRLDWMYAGTASSSAVAEERESYLLGKRRVDKIVAEATTEQPRVRFLSI
jgi:hypothetical protein